MRINNKLVMGSALSVASLLVALDSLKHPLPEASGLKDDNVAECMTNPCGIVVEVPDESGELKSNDKCSTTSGQTNPCGLTLDAQ